MPFGTRSKRTWRKQTDSDDSDDSNGSSGSAFTIVITSPSSVATQETADGTYSIAIPIAPGNDQIIVYSTSPQATAFLQTPDDVVNLLSQGVPLSSFIDYRSIQDGRRNVALLNLSDAVNNGNVLTLVGTLSPFQATDGLVQTGLNDILLTPTFIIDTDVGVLDSPLANSSAPPSAPPSLGVTEGTVDTSRVINPSGVTTNAGTV